MSEGDPRFLKILDEMRDVHIKKSADYGKDADPLANLRASEAFGIPAWKGTCIRMNDKMVRIQSFCAKGSLKNESLEDSLTDIAAYALLALILYRETMESRPAGAGEGMHTAAPVTAADRPRGGSIPPACSAHVSSPAQASASPHRHLDPNYEQR